VDASYHDGVETKMTSILSIQILLKPNVFRPKNIKAAGKKKLTDMPKA